MAGSNFQMESSPEVLLPPVKSDTRSGTFNESESNSVWKRAIVSSLAVFLLLAVVTTGIVAVAGAGPTCSVATDRGQVGRYLGDVEDQDECSYNSLIAADAAPDPHTQALKLKSFKERVREMIDSNIPVGVSKSVKVTRTQYSTGAANQAWISLETMLSTTPHETCDTVDATTFSEKFFEYEFSSPVPADVNDVSDILGSCFEASSMLRYVYKFPQLLNDGVDVRYEFHGVEGGGLPHQLWTAVKSGRKEAFLKIVYKVEVV